MYLLIVIVLTGANAMGEPFVASLATEAQCLKALPLAVEVAEKQKALGYVAVCVPVARTAGTYL